MRITVLHESDALVAVDKPMGALSVPSRMGRADPRPCVLYALTEKYGRQFYPVHRLDEEVSGVLVFAKDAASHRRLNTMFESRAARKTYEAWTEGAAPGNSGEVRFEDLLVRGKKRAFVAPHGKQAITIARIIGTARFRDSEYLRWELSPHTGRSHQLRVQLARRGYPIVGDRLYGAKNGFVDDGIALRAVQLVIDVTIEAPDLASYLSRLNAP